MPNRSFYRTPVAFYASYGFRDPDTGRWEEGYTDPLIRKVNLQPFKDGEMLTFGESTTYYTEGYKKLYLRGELSFPENPPDDSEIVFYYDSAFYQVKGNMDYTTPGKGPKHLKMLAVKFASGTEPDITPPVI
ncbi:hypothetical protein [Vreelandella arcis]|uniref:Uncharacterized protein n=1 Tax=Vreelandella arcis TaxID=416873 RepID=A0A1H0IZZ0_9GAMM|nr:hypothetical protein [Halomonas arcis]SDO37016.1 hypothetical protein SAMN04487951_12310 [Halomonas arcis]